MLVADTACELDTVKILKHFNCDRPADPRPIPELSGSNRAAVICRNLLGEGRMVAQTSWREKTIFGNPH